MPAPCLAASHNLTEWETIVLDLLTRSVRPRHSPGREEMSRGAGPGARGCRISRILTSPEQKGLVPLQRGPSGSIQPLRRPGGLPFVQESIRVPVVARIGAGPQREMAAQHDNARAGEAVELTRGLAGQRDRVFAQLVSGDSMVGAFVGDGDLVVVEGDPEIRNGDMVAAPVGDAAERTVRTPRYHFRDGGIGRVGAQSGSTAPAAHRPDQGIVKGKVILIVGQVSWPGRRRPAPQRRCRIVSPKPPGIPTSPVPATQRGLSSHGGELGIRCGGESWATSTNCRPLALRRSSAHTGSLPVCGRRP